jgi:hypothetical protein
MSPRGNPPARQHVVPAFYLRRFADITSHVLMTDKEDGRRVKSSVREVMVIKDFYTLETDGGRSYVVEEWLSKLESRTAEILRKIDEGEFPLRSKEDHDLLALYIAYQLCRGQQFRGMLDTVAEMFAEITALGLAHHSGAMRIAMEHATGQQLSDDEVKEEQRYMREALDGKRIKANVPQTAAVGDMIAIAPEVANILAQRSWMLLRTDGERFITSDVPVGMIGGTLPDGRPMPVGVMTASEISFPLDARQCILMDKPRQQEGVVRVNDEMVLALNGRHYLMARRFTFQHPEDPFVFDDRARQAATEGSQEASRRPAGA